MTPAASSRPSWFISATDPDTGPKLVYAAADEVYFTYKDLALTAPNNYRLVRYNLDGDEIKREKWEWSNPNWGTNHDTDILIDNVKTGGLSFVYYDINDGKGADGSVGGGDDYPYTIVAGLANCTPTGGATTCTSSFDWANATPPNVPDTPTALAKIKIVDSRGSESDVIKASERY